MLKGRQCFKSTCCYMRNLAKNTLDYWSTKMSFASFCLSCLSLWSLFQLHMEIGKLLCCMHAGAVYRVWWCGEAPASCGRRGRPHEVCPSGLSPPPHPLQTWSSGHAPSNAFHGPSPQSARSAPQTTEDQVKQTYKQKKTQDTWLHSSKITFGIWAEYC